MSSKDNLGDRMKVYENMETRGKVMYGIPTIVRLDGRSFSRYTKGFDRFDIDMSDAMKETTKLLVKESNALIGYTQSDEITLILLNESITSQIFFNGKKHKLISVLASIASVKFYDSIIQKKPHLLGKLPSFDCRVFQVPSKIEAWNALLWRVQDSLRNSISILAQKHFSHKELQGKSKKDMLTMLEKNGIIWGMMESRFKEGVFVRRYTYEKEVEQEDGKNILVTRSSIGELKLRKSFNRIINREKFIFDCEDPIFSICCSE